MAVEIQKSLMRETGRRRRLVRGDINTIWSCFMKLSGGVGLMIVREGGDGGCIDMYSCITLYTYKILATRSLPKDFIAVITFVTEGLALRLTNVAQRTPNPLTCSSGEDFAEERRVTARLVAGLDKARND
ncbi:hypothetical protein J6590_007083 [Homalodisca vitripennis]|nr:hypothetical protein J6590_007083 [Homalodisca vitripennis]